MLFKTFVWKCVDACYTVWYLECRTVDNAVFREGALNEVPSALP